MHGDVAGVESGKASVEITVTNRVTSDHDVTGGKSLGPTRRISNDDGTGTHAVKCVVFNQAIVGLHKNTETAQVTKRVVTKHEIAGAQIEIHEVGGVSIHGITDPHPRNGLVEG